MAESEETRQTMKAFWQEHCTEASLQDVMLNSMADKLDEAEKPEISGMLPNLSGKRVLELGAGIGRYTGFLAKRAGYVKSVDFIEEFVEKNRQLHSAAHPHVDFVCGDVVIGPGSLKPGGRLFFRESCFRQAGDRKCSCDPTQYRDPKTVLSSGMQNGSGTWNRNSTHEFLDQQQYTINGILCYERVYGKNFVSTGGLETTQEFVPKLELKEGEQVLDAGSGLGGSAFFMAENYGVDVLGIDLSTNMVHLGLDRAVRCERGTVAFEVSDLTRREFSVGTFDVIYSRDTLLHIEDKQELLQHFFQWLTPNGRLLITDYCCGAGNHTDEFKEYVRQRRYVLHSVEEYCQLLEQAGFVSVVAENHNWQFLDILCQELKKTERNREAMISEFSEKDFNEIVSGWRAKIEHVSRGDLCWGVFMAKKPATS